MMSVHDEKMKRGVRRGRVQPSVSSVGSLIPRARQKDGGGQDGEKASFDGDPIREIYTHAISFLCYPTLVALFAPRLIESALKRVGVS